MFKAIFKQKYYVITILMIIFLEPTINSVLNFWLQRIFNSATPGANELAVLRLLTIGFLLWMSKRLLSFTSSILTARFICNAKHDLKHNMFRHIFNMDISNINQIGSSGKYISAFTTDINLLETRFYAQVISLASAIISIVVLSTSLMLLEKRLAVSILGFGFIFATAPLFFTKMLNQKSERYSRAMADFTTRIKEFFAAYSSIKNNSAEDRIIRKFDENNVAVESSKFDSDFTLSVANNIGSLLAWFLQFVAVGIGIMLVIHGEITIGTVLAAQGFAGDIADPFQRIVSSWNSICSIKSIIIKFQHLSGDKRSTLPETTSVTNIDEFSEGCSVEFRNVSLILNNTPLIQDFSFIFEKGKKYLIVGENGAGKSTIFKILKRWFSAATGKILINNRDISTLSSKEVNSFISYVDSAPAVFSGTARENLTIFSEVNPERLQRAMRSAHVDLDLDRPIDDKTRTSTGQAVKLDLGRAFSLSDAKFLVFDETLANLDVETAYELEEALLSMDETVIMIAHNLSGSLIRKYDEILVMKNGRLLDHGRYERLRESCQYFNRICNIKFGT